MRVRREAHKVVMIIIRKKTGGWGLVGDRVTKRVRRLRGLAIGSFLFKLSGEGGTEGRGRLKGLDRGTTKPGPLGHDGQLSGIGRLGVKGRAGKPSRLAHQPASTTSSKTERLIALSLRLRHREFTGHIAE